MLSNLIVAFPYRKYKKITLILYLLRLIKNYNFHTKIGYCKHPRSQQPTLIYYSISRYTKLKKSHFSSPQLRSTAYTPASPYDPPHAASPALSSHPLR